MGKARPVENAGPKGGAGTPDQRHSGSEREDGDEMGGVRGGSANVGAAGERRVRGGGDSGNVSEPALAEEIDGQDGEAADQQESKMNAGDGLAEGGRGQSSSHFVRASSTTEWPFGKRY
jgi:hypothetical protein